MTQNLKRMYKLFKHEIQNNKACDKIKPKRAKIKRQKGEEEKQENKTKHKKVEIDLKTIVKDISAQITPSIKFDKKALKLVENAAEQFLNDLCKRKPQHKK